MRRSAEKDAEKERVQIQFVEDVDRVESRRTTARVFAGVGAGFALAGGALIAVDLLNGKASSAGRSKELQLSCASTGCSASWSRNF
jgi:hypothetical protein